MKQLRDKLGPLLIVRGFRIREERGNFIRFESSKIGINIGYDTREKACYIFFDKLDGYGLPLSNKAVQEIFGSHLAVENVITEKFIENLFILLKTEKGKEMLSGNIQDLVSFIDEQSAKNDAQMTMEQALKSADKAWENKDYEALVEIIDTIGLSKVSQTYQMKYKFASQRK